MTLHVIELTVNGQLVTEAVHERLTLADFLRDSLRLTGTHLGCEQGVCGACTVFLDGRSVRACLAFAVQANGRTVETIEGLSGLRADRLRHAFSQEHALQCGFCTAGVLMSAAELLDETPRPDEERVRECVSGHICRCTGYQGMVAAVLRAAEETTEVDER